MFHFDLHSNEHRSFKTQFKCYSVSMLPGAERKDVENGGKIIMPPSALDQLTRLSIVYPMLFKLTNKKTNRITHCGVLEFVAGEDLVYIPYWMMQHLLLEEGDNLQVESVSLPVATFSKFQPQSPDFLDITNPKAVLENALRHFACLTTGDVVAIKYNSRIYELCVLETKPGSAVSIIECDMNVEFAPPVGYQEPQPVQDKVEDMSVDPVDLMPQHSGFVAFHGEGNRLDGKKKKKTSVDCEPVVPKVPYKRGIPDYDYKFGTLHFLRNSRPPPSKENSTGSGPDDFKAFSGEGQSLRSNRKK
ncbi:ubiquitin recognition factor in ER-associated degradation protein 1-like [Ischnura elegans]|uniref:ubiquitin recognition factor in ER-associated degradation protein 1-like n=1 Tax=Ischnura elegans TaxID=197161 RepID=UPI001ED88360|nr:ubiquitin recognition factor in ER-associated degradation protein 1-like [Ischnura elegans]